MTNREKYMVYFSMREGTEPDKIYYSYTKNLQRLKRYQNNYSLNLIKGQVLMVISYIKTGNIYLFLKQKALELVLK